MSTYDPGSEISRFNALARDDASQSVSEDFSAVVSKALELQKASGGAFHPAVTPLVELWGFGAAGSRTNAPDSADIESILPTLTNTVQLTGRTLTKKHPSTRMDLSAIAKGYAVDHLVSVGRAFGCTNMLIEVGGEMRALGRPADREWVIGVPTPSRDHSEELTARLVMSDRSIATSGDYRNYFEDQGHTYSHIIDPRTGYPLTNKVASVSVIATNCMEADGWATAIMVLGIEAGLAAIERTKDAEAMLIVRESPGVFSQHYSSGMTNYIQTAGN